MNNRAVTAPNEDTTVEHFDDWRKGFRGHQYRLGENATDERVAADYPLVVNRTAPFTPARRALSMTNLALISSAGAYIDGTESFNVTARDGDASYREIPREVEAEDLLYAARGYDAASVRADRNAQIPIERLTEFEDNGVIGSLNQVWWSVCGFLPDVHLVREQLAPALVERVKRYEAQAALLIPASRLCHQTCGLIARALERNGIPTMIIGVDLAALESVRPPRAGYYSGKFGRIVGAPDYPQYQRRVLDEALRLIEPMDQPSVRKLAVDIESEVEVERGEK